MSDTDRLANAAGAADFLLRHVSARQLRLFKHTQTLYTNRETRLRSTAPPLYSASLPAWTLHRLRSSGSLSSTPRPFQRRELGLYSGRLALSTTPRSLYHASPSVSWRARAVPRTPRPL